MARENRTANAGRLRYGRCVNSECEMCSKDVKHPIIQEISNRKEFVCEKCGRELRECLPPVSGWQKYKGLVIGVAAVAVIGGVGAGIALNSGSDEPAANPVVEPPVIVDPVPGDTLATDTVTAAPEPVKEPENPVEVTKPTKTTVTASQNGHGTVNLGYATYTGDLKNGKPHGYGTLTYKQSHKIVDSKDYVASPGDTFEGDFRDGRISGLGYWKHDGNTIAVKP